MKILKKGSINPYVDVCDQAACPFACYLCQRYRASGGNTGSFSVSSC